MQYPKNLNSVVVMQPKDAEGMANSIDPDQTAPSVGLHCLSKNLDH